MAFRPGGAWPFLPVPASELRDQLVGLDDLWGPDGWPRQRLAQHFAERIGLTPKRFARVRRFQPLLGSVTAGGGYGDGGVTYQRWCYSCSSGTGQSWGGCGNWSRTNLGC